MRPRADDLRTDELSLEPPAGEDATNLLVLGPSGGVTGTHEQDAARIVLGDIRADDLHLTRIDWRVDLEGVELAPAG